MHERIDTIIEDLTLAEKLQLVHGAVGPDGKATGYVPGIERVGVPPLRLVDGPLGVRALGESATAFPASIALAASWNPRLAQEFGAALGRETVAHDQDVILARGLISSGFRPADGTSSTTAKTPISRLASGSGRSMGSSPQA